MTDADAGLRKTKHKKTREEVLELLVVIMLGVTALLTAWASWIGSLHGGNQATNYARSNNLAAEGNSEYNAGVQNLMQDMMLYNEVNGLMIDLHFAENRNDAESAEALQWKIDELLDGNATDEFYAAFEWAMAESETRGGSVSPFEKDGFTDSYFQTANDLIAQSDEVLEQGKKDNASGDAFGLVTVIFSVVLFLLGITGTFKSNKNKMAVLCISGVAFLIATAYMFTIPMPTGFSITSFFGGGA